MSAPKTDIEEQEKKHRTPFLGMGAMVLFAGVLLVGLILFVAFMGNDPGDGEADGSGNTAATGESAPQEDGGAQTDVEGDPAPASEAPSESTSQDGADSLGNDETEMGSEPQQQE